MGHTLCHIVVNFYGSSIFEMRMRFHLIWTGVKCHFSLLRMDICLIRAKNVTTKSVWELFEMNKRWLSLVRDIKIKKLTNGKIATLMLVIFRCWKLNVGDSFQILEVEFWSWSAHRALRLVELSESLRTSWNFDGRSLNQMFYFWFTVNLMVWFLKNHYRHLKIVIDTFFPPLVTNSNLAKF